MKESLNPTEPGRLTEPEIHELLQRMERLVNTPGGIEFSGEALLALPRSFLCN